MKRLSSLVLSLALGSAVAAPALAADRVGEANVSGIVNHVSDNNIKITDGSGHQLSFLVLPHFKNVTSDNGKGTYQMAAIKPGQYVKIYYDQKLLGQRHADRILIMTQHNRVKGVEKN